MNWPPNIRILEWDETATNNLVTVPANFLWRVSYGHMTFTASSDVATRTVSLRVRIAWSTARDIIVQSQNITASQVFTFAFNLVDDSSSAQHNQFQTLPGHREGGMWMPAGSVLDVDVVNEQAADDWDIGFIIEEYTVPRA